MLLRVAIHNDQRYIYINWKKIIMFFLSLYSLLLLSVPAYLLLKTFEGAGTVLLAL